MTIAWRRGIVEGKDDDLGSREEGLSDQATGTHSTIRGFHQRMTVAVMLSGGLMMALVVSAMAPIAHEAATYFAKSGDGDLVAQMIVTVPAIGIIVGGPICGWMIERFGSKRFLLAILALFGLSGSAGLYLDDALTLMVSRFLLGLATAGSMTAMITSITEYFTPEARSRILGYQSGTGAFAGVAAIFVAGQLGEYGGWRAPFSLYLLAFPVLLLGIRYLPEPPPREIRVRATKGAGGSILGLWPIYLMIIPMFVAVYMPNIQVSFLLRDDGITRPGTQSMVIMTGAFTVGVIALLYGRVRALLSNSQILLTCFACQGAGMVLMGLSHDPLTIALGCGILGIGTGIANPLISDLIIAKAAPEVRSRAIGASYTARYAGDFVNPLIMRPLGFAIGLHSAFILVGAAFLVGVLAAAIWRQSPAVRKSAESTG